MSALERPLRSCGRPMGHGPEATCPDGYTLQAPAGNPDALICRRAPADEPASPAGQSVLVVGALAMTAKYQKIGTRTV
ncbi:hypothetical protein [Streptomyces sp. NPDC059398]|uniref:hypothetical protein n=1 Tax=Streptomyces sp. NPDC059398 TaxID=3346820 RepID=UPI0036C4BA17